LPPFALTHPPYAGLALLFVTLLAALTLNQMEPGIFEADKDGGPRRSTRNRTKRV